MKNFLITLLAALSFYACSNAKNPGDPFIRLEEPRMSHHKTSLMTALSQRQSIREYSHHDIKMDDLSDLLWAAIGVNRPENGKLTAPTARNLQEVSVYVSFKQGTYLYNPKDHSLQLVYEGDLRGDYVAGQDFVKGAPIVLFIVSDVSSFEANSPYPFTDAGMVSQNISLFCAANGMGTVPRGMMDRKELIKRLQLKESVVPVLNHPIGYLK